jgi:hypothetical protein
MGVAHTVGQYYFYLLLLILHFDFSQHFRFHTFVVSPHVDDLKAQMFGRVKVFAICFASPTGVEK